MIGVTNNSPTQINAALIALKGEVKNEVKNEIINNIDNSVIGETYTAGDGIDITNDVISQTTDQLTFTGTQAQWEALTSAEQAKYGLVNRTDNNRGVYKNNNGTLEQIAVGIDDNTTSTSKTWSSSKIESLKPVYRRGSVTGASASNGLNIAYVTLSPAMPDTNYDVSIYCTTYSGTGSVNTNPFVTAKQTNGFQIRQWVADPNSTTSITWSYVAFKFN